jgi:hypothetical protein
MTLSPVELWRGWALCRQASLALALTVAHMCGTPCGVALIPWMILVRWRVDDGELFWCFSCVVVAPVSVASASYRYKTCPGDLSPGPLHWLVPCGRGPFAVQRVHVVPVLIAVQLHGAPGGGQITTCTNPPADILE